MCELQKSGLKNTRNKLPVVLFSYYPPKSWYRHANFVTNIFGFFCSSRRQMQVCRNYSYRFATTTFGQSQLYRVEYLPIEIIIIRFWPNSYRLRSFPKYLQHTLRVYLPFHPAPRPGDGGGAGSPTPRPRATYRLGRPV